MRSRMKSISERLTGLHPVALTRGNGKSLSLGMDKRKPPPRRHISTDQRRTLTSIRTKVLRLQKGDPRRKRPSEENAVHEVDRASAADKRLRSLIILPCQRPPFVPVVAIMGRMRAQDTADGPGGRRGSRWENKVRT